MKSGLFYLGSYQWSKNLDNISGEAAANDSSYATTTSFDHSYSNFDTRNRAVISGGYELPFGRNHDHLQGKVASAIAGGWSLQPAVQLRSGYPFSVGGSGCTFANYIGCRAFLAPGRTVASSYKSDRGISNWFDPTAFSNSPNAVTVTGTPGNYVTGARALPNLQGWVTRSRYPVVRPFRHQELPGDRAVQHAVPRRGLQHPEPRYFLQPCRRAWHSGLSG